MGNARDCHLGAGNAQDCHLARTRPPPTPAGRTADFPPVQHMVTGMQRRVRFLDCDVRAGPPASMPGGPVVKWAEFHNIVF